jgi:hypothetical protein
MCVPPLDAITLAATNVPPAVGMSHGWPSDSRRIARTARTHERSAARRPPPGVLEASRGETGLLRPPPARHPRSPVSPPPHLHTARTSPVSPPPHLHTARTSPAHAPAHRTGSLEGGPCSSLLLPPIGLPPIGLPIGLPPIGLPAIGLPIGLPPIGLPIGLPPIGLPPHCRTPSAPPAYPVSTA